MEANPVEGEGWYLSTSPTPPVSKSPRLTNENMKTELEDQEEGLSLFDKLLKTVEGYNFSLNKIEEALVKDPESDHLKQLRNDLVNLIFTTEQEMYEEMKASPGVAEIEELSFKEVSKDTQDKSDSDPVSSQPPLDPVKIEELSKQLEQYRISLERVTNAIEGGSANNEMDLQSIKADLINLIDKTEKELYEKQSGLVDEVQPNNDLKDEQNEPAEESLSVKVESELPAPVVGITNGEGDIVNDNRDSDKDPKSETLKNDIKDESNITGDENDKEDPVQVAKLKESLKEYEFSLNKVSEALVNGANKERDSEFKILQLDLMNLIEKTKVKLAGLQKKLERDIKNDVDDADISKIDDEETKKTDQQEMTGDDQKAATSSSNSTAPLQGRHTNLPVVTDPSDGSLAPKIPKRSRGRGRGRKSLC